MARVVHFEIHAHDPEVLINFYRAVFRWDILPWDDVRPPYWVVTTGPSSEPGINGGIVRQGSLPGGIGSLITIQVPTLNYALLAVRDHGGSEVVPKTALVGGGWQAFCRDPEGNVFGVYQKDERAGR